MTDSSYAVVYSKYGRWGIDACHSSREEALREAFESWEEEALNFGLLGLNANKLEDFS